MPTTEPCPHCNRPVKLDASKCPHCKRWIEEDEPDNPHAACPQCGVKAGKRVMWTFWGSFYGPALLSHVRCQDCGTTYNGKTGKSNAMGIAIFCVLVYGFLLVLVGVPILMIVLTVAGGMR